MPNSPITNTDNTSRKTDMGMKYMIHFFDLDPFGFRTACFSGFYTFFKRLVIVGI